MFTVYVPNVIWKLEQLRHLYLPEGCKQKRKLKLHTLKHLQTLVNFNTRYCSVADLSDLINLRKLVICGSSNMEDSEEVLEKKKQIVIRNKHTRPLSIESECRIDTRIVALILSSGHPICELSLKAETQKLPEYHHFSSSIACMHLMRCSLEEDPMPILEKLPNLSILKFDFEAFIGKKMVCSAQGFPKLDSLSFCYLPNLEEWKVDEGAMPTLRHLEIEGCKNLKMLPSGLSSITTLRQLKIKSMPKAFKDKVVEGGEDFYKVQHVPSITIFEDSDE